MNLKNTLNVYQVNPIKILLVVSVLLAPMISSAQQTTPDSAMWLPARYNLLNLRANWLQTNNAAGMQLDSLTPLGRTQLGFSNLQGSLKLAQQPQSSQQFYFNSERYQPLGKAIFYGSFSFKQQWDKNIRMADVLDPYRGTPYLLADSIGGDWRKQLYALQLKAATPQLFNNKLTLGLSAMLNVGTGARQNDPRPLSTANEINLAPSLIWSLNSKSHIGVNGLYGRYREEISLEVKNTYVNHYLYKFLGVGQYELPAIFSVGASRTYDGHKFGGDVQYEFRGANLTWLTTAGYHSYKEQVLDGSSVPRKSGTWKQESYMASSMLRFSKGNLLHHISLSAQRTEDTGIEFHEYYNTVAKAWQTILEAPFYLAQTDRAGLTYTLVTQHPTQIYNWLAQVGVNYLSVDKNYLVPVAYQQVQRIDLLAKVAKNWITGQSSSLQAGLNVVYSASLDQSISYIPITGDRTLVAREVLFPDQAYLAANYTSVNLNLQYNFGLRQVPNSRFFINGTVNSQQSNSAQNTYPNALGNRTLINISIGAFY